MMAQSNISFLPSTKLNKMVNNEIKVADCLNTIKW